MYRDDRLETGPRTIGPLSVPDTLAPEPNDAPPRDWKRSVLILGLGLLSWVATYVGMMELIEANLGSLGITHRLIIGFSVAMLMVMIVWLLDQIFRPQPFLTRAFYVGGYLFLSVISVGFGFGFYWKVLESRGEATRSAESAITQVQASLSGASTRLNQLEATLVQLAQVSTEKAELERTKGSSCPNSRPGDGPRRRMRDDDAAKFSFASQLVGGRATVVKSDIAGLETSLAKVISADPSTFDAKTGTRNAFLRELARKLDMTTARFNAFRSDPQLRQIRSDLAARSQQTTFDNGRGGTLSCPDAQLQTALGGVVKAIEQLPTLEKTEIAVVEGSEATIEAFRRLTTTLAGALTFKLPPSADELRELQKKAIQTVENGNGNPSSAAIRAMAMQGGLSQRDYVPLGVALFVDFCLFLVSLVQRPAGRLSTLLPKMQAAERGPIIQILSRFNEIHHDRQVRENFEIFRHVVFDMNGDYYAAIPLDAPPRLNPEQRESLRIEAQLLGNLFASFEKEKLFKRTLLPTTSSVQKRLQRQGSKFAGSEAFRVYKFADGAWSEIILGAVMGAARRMERSNETARVATEAMATGSATTGAFEAVPNRQDEHQHGRNQERFDAIKSDTGSLDTAAHQTMADDEVAYTAAPAAVMMATRGGALRQAETHQDLSIDPDHITRFGPYAKIYRPEPPAYATAPQGPRVAWPPPPLPEAVVDVTRPKAARHDDVDINRPAVADASLQMHDVETPDESAMILPLERHPFAQQDGDAADDDDSQANATRHASITLSRETATFSVPVSEAALPKRLAAALQAMQAGQPRLLDVTDHHQGFAADTGNDRDVHLSAADRALIGRMAPPAAE